MRKLFTRSLQICGMAGLAFTMAVTDGQASGNLQNTPAKANPVELECLAKALYFEARGEPVAGQQAVAEVILNRRDSGQFPRTVCGVVTQSNSGGCQFSYQCSGRGQTIREKAAYARAEKIAEAALIGAPRDLTDGATYFHARSVSPNWSRRFVRTTRIGAHIFYRPNQQRQASN